MYLLNSNGSCHGARFENPRRGYAVKKRPHPIVVKHVYEVGNPDAGLPRRHAHGELVPEIADRRFAHSGNAKMFTQPGSQLNIEIIQRNNSVKVSGAGEKTHMDKPMEKPK